MPIVQNCTRFVELIDFMEKEKPTANSGWYLDRYFRKRYTRAERLEFRKYMTGKIKPLLYSNACLPPNLVKGVMDAITVTDMNFPTIRAETKIGCKEIDQRYIRPDGTIIPVGRARYNEAMNWGMMPLVEGLRERHKLEAIQVLCEGGYVLHTTEGKNLGTVDFGREEQLLNVDLSGTPNDLSNVCSKPLKVLQSLIQNMARCKGIAGGIDIIWSQYAWDWFEAHDERESVKANQRPTLTLGLNDEMFFGYDDVQFMGTTNGGTLAHWVDNSLYCNEDGDEVPVLQPGEVMIISRGGFDGQRVFRTITVDNYEELPAGADFFLYDDPAEIYNKKCRSFEPWLEEYHLMVPKNVNGALKFKWVDPAAGDQCTQCEECP